MTDSTVNRSSPPVLQQAAHAHPPLVPPYARRLNAQQQRACLAPLQRPLLVLAGAGSGKTGVMAARVQHMLAQGVPSSTILAVTFTRAAEHAMRERLKSTLGAHTTKAIRVSTFHALALSICRMYADRLDNLSADFLVCTTAQQMHVVAHAVAELRVRRAVAAAAAAGTLADGAQPQAPAAPVPPDAGCLLRALLQAKAQGRGPESMRDESLCFVWERYEAWLRERGALDMVDFVRVAARILSSVPAARDALRKAHAHVLVDEFQDTNALQLELLKLLAPPGAARLTVVGDDDQSIYAFQGAQGPAAVRAFLAVYPDATRVALEQNYRSSGAIVRAASALAVHNTMRWDKRVFTANPDGERVAVVECRTVRDEAEHVVETVRRLLRDGLKLSEVAVLYRSQRTGVEMQSALLAAGIPFNTHRANLWRTLQVEGTLALLHFLLRPDDDAYFSAALDALIGPAAAASDTGTHAVLSVLKQYRTGCLAPASQTAASLWAVAGQLVTEGEARAAAAKAETWPETPGAPAPKRLRPSPKTPPAPITPAMANQAPVVRGLGRAAVAAGADNQAAGARSGGAPAYLCGPGGSARMGATDEATAEVPPKPSPHVRNCALQRAHHPPPQLPSHEPGPAQLAALSRALKTLSRLQCRLGTLQLCALVQRCAESVGSSRQALHSSPRAVRGSTLLNEQSEPRTLLQILVDEARRVEAQSREAEAEAAPSAARAPYGWVESLVARAKARLRCYIDQLEQLAMEQEMTIADDHADALTLCTMHGAKGLEWPAVLCVRMNEGVCPSSAALASPPTAQSRAMLEDERRVAYVGLSRAKARLVLSHVTVDAAGAPAVASRFLRELPSQILERSLRYS